ncbi:zinc ribbon domain-containing protein [Paenibacillus sp. M1]|uniref:Zinc ribbon domain-containing protein n=1 Tax=Paenibacillus haidiansis TaxID=1574488 RepID=A0ABU7VPU3_9BACL
MIECPWCHHQVEIRNGRCPKCREHLYEITDQDFEAEYEEGAGRDDYEIYVEDESPVLSVEEVIENRFKCAKCGGTECKVNEVAMTGAGLSKLLDIQHHHYLFVSCGSCGYVEIYDPDVLRGMKAGQFGTMIDVLFGG